jgi:guanine deaminase
MKNETRVDIKPKIFDRNGKLLDSKIKDAVSTNNVVRIAIKNEASCEEFVYVVITAVDGANLKGIIHDVARTSNIISIENGDSIDFTRLDIREVPLDCMGNENLRIFFGSTNDVKWIIHGNFVVPVTSNNIFVDSYNGSNYDDEEDDNLLWLGPGRFLKLLLDYAIIVNSIGVVVSFLSYKQFCKIYNGFENLFPMTVIHCNLRTEFICPGFIDLHIHAPQFSYTGTATDRPLMGMNGWLEKYTFPAESRLATDSEFAQRVYSTCVKTTLKNGTTTAVYFGTLHKQPCQVLVDCAIQQKQRALIGKVCMDRNSPDDYSHSTEKNVQETIDLVEYIHKQAGARISSNAVIHDTILPLVLPMITPRFIPTCSPRLLTELGKIAKKYNCHITSHVSESIDEVEYTNYIDKTEDGGDGTRTDTEIFHSHDLLSNQCIMAHAIYLNKSDIRLFQQMQTGIAHCPLSNFFFAGGTLPCKSLLKQGINVGLGTDVAGGYNPSIFNSMRMAVIASRSLEHTYNYVSMHHNNKERLPVEDPTIDYRHAFYMATIGGAQVLGLENSIGTFAVGMEFDALILSTSVVPSHTDNIHVTDGVDTIADIFQKICVLGDDRNVKHVFVQGNMVK